MKSSGTPLAGLRTFESLFDRSWPCRLTFACCCIIFLAPVRRRQFDLACAFDFYNEIRFLDDFTTVCGSPASGARSCEGSNSAMARPTWSVQQSASLSTMRRSRRAQIAPSLECLHEFLEAKFRGSVVIRITASSLISKLTFVTVRLNDEAHLRRVPSKTFREPLRQPTPSTMCLLQLFPEAL